jgi:hypothetical protein
MPKVIASTASPAQEAQRWLDKTPCPQTGSGNREVHSWLLSAANACRIFHMKPEEAAAFLTYGSQGCGRQVTRREINETIQTAYNETVTGESKAKQQKPEYKPEALEAQASRVGPHIDAQWLEDFSPIPVETARRRSFSGIYSSQENAYSSGPSRMLGGRQHFTSATTSETSIA